MTMIKLEIADAIARIDLSRAPARNALDDEGWRALARAISTVRKSDARVLIVGSDVPGSFCAGSDLAGVLRLVDHPEERAGFRSLMRAAFDPLRALAIPTIAAIDGNCFGAGVALALACDIRIGGERARFAVTPAKLGLSYPREDVVLLVEAVGRGQAARLLFGAQTIDAAEAARIGLVQNATPSAGEAALGLSMAIAANAPISVAALKRMLASEGAADDAIAADFDRCFESDALQEGLAAMRERREPKF